MKRHDNDNIIENWQSHIALLASHQVKLIFI